MMGNQHMSPERRRRLYVYHVQGCDSSDIAGAGKGRKDRPGVQEEVGYPHRAHHPREGQR